LVTQTLDKPKTSNGKFYRYSDNEKELIRLYFNGKRLNTEKIISLIMTQCGIVRSYNSVRAQAGMMGLTTPIRTWTKEDFDTLSEMVGHYSLRKISRRLKRTRASIHHKLEFLKLSANLRNGWYNANDVTLILGVGLKTVRKWLSDCTLIAEKEGNGYHILAKDLKSFVLKYPTELTGRNIDLVQYNELLCSNGVIRKDD
jgi:hypothetical protein